MGYINHQGHIFYIKETSDTTVTYGWLKYKGWGTHEEDIHTLTFKDKNNIITEICSDIDSKATWTDVKEYLENAAILYCDKDDNPGVTFGLHHSDCICMFSELELRAKDRHDEIQGFWTTHDRFLTREQAYKLACRMRQMKDSYPCVIDEDRRLCSEYVNFKRRTSY